ncbi:MAG: hypothetical protein MJ105_01935 [Lachnospiraceae bacterium]|nr:hypothetical protein [Lachnospiraceae bacterium]
MKNYWKVLKQNTGETLMEVVISLAFFAITISFVTTSFSASNQITIDNYEAREKLSEDMKMVNAAHKKADLAAIGTFDSVTDCAVNYTITPANGVGGTNGQMQMTMIHQGAFVKYIER